MRKLFSLAIVLLIGVSSCKKSWISEQLDYIQDKMVDLESQAKQAIDDHPDIQQSVMDEVDKLQNLVDKDFTYYSNELTDFANDMYDHIEEIVTNDQRKQNLKVASSNEQTSEQELSFRTPKFEKSNNERKGDVTIIIDETYDFNPLANSTIVDLTPTN
ncbi:UNKNOWN [Stylonychia lemnae]|uniref:Uncharacterized protein n=1 Tax=Stylonychia lemnae TaxID=5949 RepID=A0A078AQ27_STYLE|nr:UNKNOWN [Stylonychia lemnae]|eukprot:CDW83048.1 UNKNOWN [Stylonychia lemnae]